MTLNINEILKNIEIADLTVFGNLGYVEPHFDIILDFDNLQEAESAKSYLLQLVRIREASQKLLDEWEGKQTLHEESNYLLIQKFHDLANALEVKN
ncbi:MAG: hypothetical protein K5785_00775 [Nitrosarchaeum sp.]|nr:hypothetical protein [Nitrosarchaeum sp.]